jgi:hypothetical protein
MLEVDYDTNYGGPPYGFEYYFVERHNFGWTLISIVKVNRDEWRVYWKRITE